MTTGNVLNPGSMYCQRLPSLLVIVIGQSDVMSHHNKHNNKNYHSYNMSDNMRGLHYEAGFEVGEVTLGLTLGYQSYDGGSLLTRYIAMVTYADRLTCLCCR